MGAISSAEQPSRSSSLFSSPALHTYNQNSSTDDDVKAVQTITCFSLISCAIPRPSFDYYVSIIRTMPSPTSVLQTQSEKKSDKKRNNNHYKVNMYKPAVSSASETKLVATICGPPLLAMLARLSLSRFLSKYTLMYSCRESLRDNNSCSCSGSIPRRNDVANKQHLQQLPTVSSPHRLQPIAAAALVFLQQISQFVLFFFFFFFPAAEFVFFFK